MTYTPPERFNMADYFLEARLRDGIGDKTALLTDDRSWTYSEVRELAARYGDLLTRLGVEPEQRVVLALPDGADFVGAFFGAISIGAVVVMVNPHLKPDAVSYFYELTRAKVALIASESEPVFTEAAEAAEEPRFLKHLLVVDTDEHRERLKSSGTKFEIFPSHRDDAVVWLFSGGTTGFPKAVVQSHRSFANSTELYAKGVLNIGPDDITLSVPKLFFGYATGSNLLFPFSVGGASILFPGRSTADALFERIAKHRPTILINVPTMIQQMLASPTLGDQDLSCLRLATSAGEALPVELHERWDRAFGVDLLDGLGTAEQWHVFVTNRPGDVRPGTLGRVVEGFELDVRDDDGRSLPHGEIGWLWVKGESRAIGYWQRMERTMQAFRGEWYVSGDMVCRDNDGYVSYCGRGDDMLKVSGKWLSPQEVENCLARHPAVREVAVVGVSTPDGLVKPRAYVLRGATDRSDQTLTKDLQTFVKERLDPYKYPREVVFLDEFPRTHLGKVDRGKLKEM